jgi:hypothetical protein
MCVWAARRGPPILLCLITCASEGRPALGLTRLLSVSRIAALFRQTVKLDCDSQEKCGFSLAPVGLGLSATSERFRAQIEPTHAPSPSRVSPARSGRRTGRASPECWQSRKHADNCLDGRLPGTSEALPKKDGKRGIHHGSPKQHEEGPRPLATASPPYWRRLAAGASNRTRTRQGTTGTGRHNGLTDQHVRRRRTWVMCQFQTAAARTAVATECRTARLARCAPVLLRYLQ